MEILSLKPTSTLQRINGAPCRVWLGKTHDGIDVAVFVASVGAIDHKHDADFLQHVTDAILKPDCPTFEAGELDLRLTI